ncbi:MAG: Txe/YoeB family addiction module toxin [Spirochaetaceae bacterium]|jgi:toxin YoeB|nr:Txe/YoeB family addiction module toxin [Spirochaetaceae bacterium]
MSRKVNWHEDAWDDYIYWQGQDKKTLKKINTLIKLSQRSPKEGAEPLKGNLEGFYSRHINKKDVLVYGADAESITIIQCRFHYSDQ